MGLHNNNNNNNNYKMIIIIIIILSSPMGLHIIIIIIIIPLLSVWVYIIIIIIIIIIIFLSSPVGLHGLFYCEIPAINLSVRNETLIVVSEVSWSNWGGDFFFPGRTLYYGICDKLSLETEFQKVEWPHYFPTELMRSLVWKHAYIL